MKWPWSKKLLLSAEEKEENKRTEQPPQRVADGILHLMKNKKQPLQACATSTHKSTINQDYCVSFLNQNLNFSGLILADGIGSHFKSEIASTFCCTRLKQLIEDIQQDEDLDLSKLFLQVKKDLELYVSTEAELQASIINKEESLGTTLLCIVDRETDYLLAYAGNGSIWHISGRFNEFGSYYLLPWNSINLLNPHTVEQGGKAALYRYISISDVSPVPTVISLSKHLDAPGELLVLTTDGVISNDAIKVGKDEAGTIWIRGEETMSLLYTTLSDFLKTDPDNATNEDLKFALEGFLRLLREKSLMHDDTTLGVIISRVALDYHQTQYDALKPAP